MPPGERRRPPPDAEIDAEEFSWRASPDRAKSYSNSHASAQSVRFDDHARELGEDEMRQLAPSIFATERHHSRTRRFAPIPTIEVLRGLGREGFSVVGAKQCMVRHEDRRDFTKHMVRLRRLDEDKKYRVGDTVFEIILKNANDGSSAYELLAGAFRGACLNSLVTQTYDMESLRVRHSGDVQTKVIEGTFRVLDTAEQTLQAPQDWPQITMNREEQVIFADAARVRRSAGAGCRRRVG
jgi:hypothetical protein